MSKLSDTQSTILAAAARRPDGNVLPLPDSLRGGAATKVVGALLFINPAGLDALGLGDGAPAAGRTAAVPGEAPEDSAPPQEPSAGRTGARTGKMRERTKQAQLVAMLRRAEGATIAEVVAATGWQPYTVRGALAGALKKRLGLTVVSEKVEGRGRVYRVAG